MSELKCFLMERTNLASESLRRYHSSGPGVEHYPDAEVSISASVPYDSPYEGQGLDDHPHDDPRWPTQCTCGCGYQFLPTDHWQHRLERLYRAPDGTLYESHKAPPGAMFFASWYAEIGWVGPDGKTLCVVLPDRTVWVVDGPANNNPGKAPAWQRTGTLPNVSATPSIKSPRYHGFLTNGVLIACSDSQT